MIVLYLALLCGGLVFFVGSYVAQYRVASLLRRDYPQQWAIVAVPEQGRPSAVRTWVRLQHVLRSSALSALDDAVINRWLRVWRYSPWLGWLCWLGALGMRFWLR